MQLVSLLAPNADPLYGALAAYLSRATGVPVSARGDLRWNERVALVDAGGADLVAICGGPYARTGRARHLELLVAPVAFGARAGRAVFHSDVMVRRASPLQRLSDLRGQRFAVNDVESLSGHDAVVAALAALGGHRGFFGSIVVSGSHQASMDMIAADLVDGAAVDSFVARTELRRRPLLASSLRLLERLGPWPAPPIAVASHVEPATRDRLRASLAGAHLSLRGRRLLAAWGIERFVPVVDDDYADVRSLLVEVSGAKLVPRRDAMSGEGGRSCLSM